MAQRVEPRWLREDEQRAWRAYLEATRLLVDALDRQLQSAAALSHADFEVLVRLSEAPDRQMRMSDLSNLTTFSRSRLSHAVTRLEAAGWVRRTVCATDRRGVVAELTESGFAKLSAAAPKHVAEVRRLVFDRLSPAQVNQLRALFVAIGVPLAEEAGCTPSCVSDEPR